MKHIKTFEAFTQEQQLDEGFVGDALKKGGEAIKKGVSKMIGEISVEDAKKIAEKRFPKHIENAKKFDANPDNVKLAKEKQGEKYMSAEDSLYHAITINKNIEKIAWDKTKGVYRDPLKYGAKGLGGGSISGGGND
jgi:hypothetical protein